MTHVLKLKTATFFSQYHLQPMGKGTILLQPEDNPAGVYYLKAGHVKMYYISSQGIEITLHIFNPESFFPMTWVLNDIPNRYYYEAFTDIEMYCVPKNKVLSFLKNEPDVLLDLTRRIFSGVDKLTMRIEHMAYEKSYGKVISILMYLSKHFGLAKDNTVYLKYVFTHHDIGSLAGISRETATRVLGKLKRRGIIVLNEEHMWTIPDVRTLENELHASV